MIYIYMYISFTYIPTPQGGGADHRYLYIPLHPHMGIISTRGPVDPYPLGGGGTGRAASYKLPCVYHV